MSPRIVLGSITLLLAWSAFSCKYITPERYVDYNKGRVPINLPRDMKGSDRDSNIERESAVIITVTADGRVYVGTDHSPIDGRDLAAKIKSLLESQPEKDRIAYLAVDVASDYGQVVAVCDQIRKISAAGVGLLVIRANDDWPSRLLVEPQPLADPNEEISKLKPNPLTLVVEIRPDLTLRLNQDPIGSTTDLDPLEKMLQRIFTLRLEQHAYREGFETVTNVPESERIEKTVTINAAKGLEYGDVVKVIDAVKRAGSSPIVLQLDEGLGPLTAQ